MAAAKKGRKKDNRSRFLCSFGGCFGISNKVSADHSDRKSVPGRQPRGALPVNDHYTPAPPSETVKTSSREIHVVEQDEEKKIASPSADELIITNKRRENIDESSPMTTSSIIKRAETQNATVNHTSTNQRKLSHSVSLPLQHQKKQKPSPPPPVAAVGGDKKGNKAAVGGEFDSTVGAVIVSVTLVVMIIWGKVWAIVCAAAWFYLVPRFRAKMDESYAVKFKSGESDGVDFDSWEYKKKVVLQGLLDRNQDQ